MQTRAKPTSTLGPDLWTDKHEAEEIRLSKMIGTANDWFPYFKAGWGFRRVIIIPKEYLGTMNEQWDDCEPFYREDLGCCIWSPARCGTKERGETWRAIRYK